MFSLLTCEDTCEPAIQQIKISGLPSLVQAISNIVTKKLKTDIVHYEIQFLSCTSNMDLHQIKHIMQSTRENIVTGMIIWNLLQKRKDCNR